MNNAEWLGLLDDARDWIADAFPGQSDDAKSLTGSETYKVVQRHYDGGWNAFVQDNGAFAYVGGNR